MRRALEIPLGGLENIVTDIYHNQGRLRIVIEKANALMQKSKDTPEHANHDDDLAVSRLTQGGMISLSRTMLKLEALSNSKLSPES